MILEVFDVEHGACALVTTSSGRHILIDCGDNTTTGWQPGTALRSRGVTELERLIVTNYDEDHVSGYENLIANVWVRGLQRNGSVSASDLHQLKSEDGMGLGIEALCRSFGGFSGPPLPSQVDDVVITPFLNHYGLAPYGFDDENNLSLVVFLCSGQHCIVFPGDMEKAGWSALLQNPAFVQMLNRVTIFVASHHGRENGYSDDVMSLCPNIDVVIISDKKKGFQSQETTDRYRLHAKGFDYYGTRRHVLTTRSDGSMTFVIPSLGLASVFLGTAAA